MENGQKKISELFDGRKIFSVPNYQRAFAWEEKQLADFIDDFENQDVSREYFFGTILIQERTSEKSFSMIDIVDGQQRITTIIIFMKNLIDILEGDEEEIEILRDTYIQYKGEPKLHVLPQDDDFFQSYILNANPFSKDMIRTPSQRKLWYANKYLEDAVERYSQAQLWELKDIVENTKVLTYSVLDNSEAALIFETTNDRGKPLTNLEKTKSFLMYKTYLVAENPETKLAQIQEQFRGIYRDLEEMEGGLEEDAILQYHFIAFEKWSSREFQKPVASIKKQINESIQSEDKVLTSEFIDRYSRELQESFAVVKKLHIDPPSEFLDIIALQRIANYYPLLIKAYKMDETRDKDYFRTIARLLEIASFRMYGIRRYRSNAASIRLFTIARNFTGDYSKLIIEIKELLQYYCNDASFRSALRDESLFHRGRGRDILYLLWKYENFLRIAEQPIARELSIDDFLETRQKLKFSIEHIVPQNPRESRVVSDSGILPEMTEDFQEKYLHSLGNLTFDPLSANISKSNQDFEMKNQKYFAKAPFKTQNELNGFINPETNKWDETSISKRAEKIINFAMDYWDFTKV